MRNFHGCCIVGCKMPAVSLSPMGDWHFLLKSDAEAPPPRGDFSPYAQTFLIFLESNRLDALRNMRSSSQLMGFSTIMKFHHGITEFHGV